MSFIIKINDIKVYPSSVCNICLQEKKKIIKCNECNFNVCKKCINKWYKFNKICPQCKYENTYDIESNCKMINLIFKKIKWLISCIKKTVLFYFQNIKKFSNRLSNKCIRCTCSKSTINLLGNSTVCFGTSILFIIYTSLYLTSYLILICLAVFVIILFIYLATCCCCCRHDLFLIKFF